MYFATNICPKESTNLTGHMKKQIFPHLNNFPLLKVYKYFIFYRGYCPQLLYR